MNPAAHAAAPRRWVACADDYAIDGGAVDAILGLIDAGRLTATSVLVDAPLWRSTAPALVQAVAAGGGPPRADVGLHLNLTQAFAGRAMQAWPLRALIVRCAARLMERAPLRAAIERQLDAFEDALGRSPDYVDGHQHVHQFAQVREELLAALARRYPQRHPWIRSTRRPLGVRDAKARTIATLGDAGLRRQARLGGFATSDWMVGVYGFDGDADAYLQRLEAWMREGPDGSVFMCHPASRAEAGDAIGSARVVEQAVLAGPDFALALQRHGIRLVRGTELLRRA